MEKHSFIFRWVLNALALLVTAYIITGIEINSIVAFLFAPFVLGIVNAVIRPIVILFTLPINVLTLGLFTLLINGLMLKITAALVVGFEVYGFWSTVIGALVLSLVSGLLSIIFTQ